MGVRKFIFSLKQGALGPTGRCVMRVALVAFVAFLMSGCFTSHTGLRSGGLEYSASGFMGPGPMEMATADLTSAQADRVRAEGRALEAHPELFMGWRGYGGYYGYGSYGRVDPSYYYPTSYYGSPTAASPSCEDRARTLEGQATDFEQRLDVLEGRQP